MKATGCVSCETGEAFACTCARCSDVASALIRGARCLKILHWRCFKDAVLQVCTASRPELLTISRRVAEANATTRPRRTHRNALASKCVNLMCVQVRQDQKHRVYIIFYNAALILNLVMDIALQGSEDASQAQFGFVVSPQLFAQTRDRKAISVTCRWSASARAWQMAAFWGACRASRILLIGTDQGQRPSRPLSGLNVGPTVASAGMNSRLLSEPEPD